MPSACIEIALKLLSAAPKVSVVAQPQCSFSCICAMLQCAISTLADYYVEGPYTVPPVARSALASTYVSSGNLTLSDYISRSQARVTVSPPCVPQPPPPWVHCSLV